MDVERVARKLQALMPKQVAHWLRAREMADSDLKELIDKQILHTAQQRLGNYRNKLLLSLPPAKKISGELKLGSVVYDQPRWLAGLSKEELVSNLAIFGRSGAGKSNTAFHLMLQLIEQDIPFLFLDWKRTARHLIPHIDKPVQLYTAGRSLSPFPFNPMIPPPGIESKTYINQVIDVIAQAFTLGEGAKSIIQKAFTSAQEKTGAWPTASDLLTAVEQQGLKGRAGNWQVSALRALQSLASMEDHDTTPANQADLVRTLSSSHTIIELDGLSQSMRKFLIPMLCLWLFHLRLGRPEREELAMVVFVEEAHHVFYRQEQRSQESLMEMLIRQCRELGIGMVIVDQHPHLISSAALGNTYTSICMNLKEPSDVNRAAAVSMVDAEDKPHFHMLPTGQGVVKLQDRWRYPFLVKFPLVPVAKGAVTDDDVKRYLLSPKAHSGGKPSHSEAFEHIRPIRVCDDALNTDELVLIEDVIAHADDGVKDRYARLGWSASKGQRIKEALLKRGWLRSESVAVGNTRKSLLGLTRAGREMLGIGEHGTERASLVHEFWKNSCARHLEGMGYSVETEAPRRGGRVDVLARKDEQTLAVEIETGKSDVVENVRNCLRSGFDNILLLVTDEKALTSIERQLATANLIVPDRVKVVLRNEFRKAA